MTLLKMSLFLYILMHLTLSVLYLEYYFYLLDRRTKFKIIIPGFLS